MLNLILAAVLAQAAPDAQWRFYFYRQGSAGRLSYDPASVRRNGTSIDVNVQFMYPGARQDGGERWLLWRMHLDCVARTAAMLSVVGYDDAGRQLFDRPFPEDQQVAFSAPADSPHGVLLGLLCPG